MSVMNQVENVPLVGMYSFWVQSITHGTSKSSFHIISIIREEEELLTLNFLGIYLVLFTVVES